MSKILDFFLLDRFYEEPKTGTCTIQHGGPIYGTKTDCNVYGGDYLEPSDEIIGYNPITYTTETYYIPSSIPQTIRNIHNRMFLILVLGFVFEVMASAMADWNSMYGINAPIFIFNIASSCIFFGIIIVGAYISLSSCLDGNNSEPITTEKKLQRKASMMYWWFVISMSVLSFYDIYVMPSYGETHLTTLCVYIWLSFIILLMTFLMWILLIKWKLATKPLPQPQNNTISASVTV